MIMMKKKQRGKLHIDNQGSAMIITLVVSIVVIMFCVTALAVSYLLFASAAKKVTQDQCRELAKSVSSELQAEIADVDYGSSYEKEKAALYNDEDSLWQYLRYNVCHDSWGYYQEDAKDDDAHGKNKAFRYFKLDVTGGDTSEYSSYTGDISVCIYWTNDAGDSYESNKDKTCLYVKVTCTRGDESSTITSRYRLNCVKPATDSEASGSDSGESDTTSATTTDTTENTTINPDENCIDTTERWTWSFVGRD